MYTALIQPRKAEEIATCVGVSKSLVHQVISRYNREGIEAIEIKSCGGRYHEYLTKEEEKQFLAPFFQLAEQGELTTTEKIRRMYEERIGHQVHAHDHLSTFGASRLAKSVTSITAPKSR